MFRHSGFIVGVALGLGVGVAFGACASSSATGIAPEAHAATTDDVTKAEAAAKAPIGPTVKDASAQERRGTPSGKASITLLAQGENAFLGRLEMVAGGAVPEHRDATEEYIYILEGGGEMMIDDAPHKVSPGTAIFMPAGAKVSFKGDDTPLVALQVFAGPEPAAKYDGWIPLK